MMIFNFIILNGFTRSKNRIIKDYIRRSSLSLSLSLFLFLSFLSLVINGWLLLLSRPGLLISGVVIMDGYRNKMSDSKSTDILYTWIHTYHITTNSIVKKTSIHIIVTPTRRLYLLAHHFRQSIVFSRFCPFLSFSNRVKVPKSSRRL